MRIMEMTRRGFVASASAAAGLVGSGLGATFAMADEAAEQTAVSGDAFVWPGEEPQIDDADIVETVDTEILVCGAGHAAV